MKSKNLWIVSLSDIESNYDFFVESLELVEKEYGVPIVKFEGDRIVWAGNNYELIINGDLFQHSRLENPQTKEFASAIKSLVDSAPYGSVLLTVGNHDVGMFLNDYQDFSYKYPTDEEMEEIGDFVEYYKGLIDRGIVRVAIPGYRYTYVHAGQMNEWINKEIKDMNDFLTKLTKKNLHISAINSIKSSRGDEDTPLSSISFSELSKEEKIQKLIGIGNTYLGNGTGKNPHAGVLWIRPKMLKNGPKQIVGHTGFSRPWKYNNLIMENTQAGSRKEPSVVAEKPDSVYAITKSDGEYKLD